LPRSLALAVSNGSLRSLRCSPGSRRLRRIRRNACVGELALFSTRFVGSSCRSAARTSRARSALGSRRHRCRSGRLRTAARDPGLDCLARWRSLRAVNQDVFPREAMNSARTGHIRSSYAALCGERLLHSPPQNITASSKPGRKAGRPSFT